MIWHLHNRREKEENDISWWNWFFAVISFTFWWNWFRACFFFCWNCIMIYLRNSCPVNRYALIYVQCYLCICKMIVWLHSVLGTLPTLSSRLKKFSQQCSNEDSCYSIISITAMSFFFIDCSFFLLFGS